VHTSMHAPTQSSAIAAKRPIGAILATSAACCMLVMLPTVSAFAPLGAHHIAPPRSAVTIATTFSSSTRLHSDWSDFSYIDDDDDDDLLGDSMKSVDFADENDPQEVKAQVGSSLEPPELDWFGDPLEVPLGTALPLEADTIQGLLAACRTEIGTMFGYSAENRGVGITGGVDFVELDGPVVVLRLKGRFWHQRTTVLDRVAAYLQGRCPEIVDVVVEDEWQLTDEANDAAM
jgi:hypothetical protein